MAVDSRRLALAVGVVVVVLGGGTVSTVGAAGTSGNGTVDASDVRVEVTVVREGTGLEYRMSFRFPEELEEFRALLYDGRVTGTGGFVASGPEGRYLRWTGRRTATLTVEQNVARPDCLCVVTENATLAEPLRARFELYVDGTQRHAHLTEWYGGPAVSLEVTLPDGQYLPGAVVVGPHEQVEGVTAAGERVRVLGPATAESHPEAILTAVRRAAPLFDVGAVPRERVTVVVVPDPPAERRLAGGMTDSGRAVRNRYLFVRDGTGPGTWLHEYVHSRQTFTTTEEMRWFTEGSAEYYGVYLADRIEGRGLERVDDRFGREPGASGVLSRPDTWESRYVPYTTGGQVVAYLDRRVRAETDGRRTFLDVFRRLNGRENVSVADLRDATAAVVGSRTLDDEITRYVTTRATPAADSEAYLPRPTAAVRDAPERERSVESSADLRLETSQPEERPVRESVSVSPRPPRLGWLLGAGLTVFAAVLVRRLR